jgi:cytochrome P450
MKHLAINGGSVDIWKWWRFITTDVIAEMSFSHSFNMIESGQDTEYIQALQNAGTNVILRVIFPFAELMRYLPWKKIQDIINAKNILKEKGEQAVAQMRQTEAPGESLFSNMLEQAESNEKGLITFEDMNAEAALFLVAGAETTASTLTYLVWVVQKKPDLQQRLEQEVGALGPDFEDSDLERLPILNNVINETLRLYNPAAPSTPRKAPPEGVVVGGYAIPGNTTVSTHMWSICRDPKIYPNPEE